MRGIAFLSFRSFSNVRITRALKPYVPEQLHPHYRKLRELMKRWTSSPKSYQDRIRSELVHYSETETVHDLPRILTYWFERHIVPVTKTFGFGNSIEMFRTYIAQVCRERPEEICRILSIGSGDSATEINIAQWLFEQNIRNFHFECLDLNPEVLDRGRRAAAKQGSADYFQFATFDINSWKPFRQYPVVLAIQCLHHFVELELLFDKIHSALHPDGFFLTDDMIGRNGHQRWPEALKFVEQFWAELPDSCRYNYRLKRMEPRYQDWDCSVAGFEGIRAEDILPLLMERFHFDFFFGFGNIIDVFVDRIFGPNFDPNREWDRDFIDRVHAVDVREIEGGRLKPTHIYAAMMKRPSSSPKFYKHLTPEFSVRVPDKSRVNGKLNVR
jgi:SAM-dependent methyltransferase